MKQILQYLSHQPTFDDEIILSAQKNVNDQVYYKDLVTEINKDSKLILLIGRWGAGKTSTLKQINKTESGIHLDFVNFFGVRNPEEAQNHLVGFWANLINCIIFTYTLIKLQNAIAKPDYEVLSAIASIFVSYLIVKHSRFVFIFNFLVQYLFRCLFRFKKNLVIEDLDRSPMSIDEKFSFLAQLPPYFGQYIVTYGYSNLDEEIDLIEIGAKLNAKVISLKPQPTLIYSVISSKMAIFPFVQGAKWMSEVSLRRHLKICLGVNELSSTMADIEKKSLLVEVYFKEVIRPLIPADRDESDINLRFDSVFKYSTQLNLTSGELNLIDSFVNSIDNNFFSTYFLKNTPPAQQSSPSNWQEVEYRKIKGMLPEFNI